MELMNYFFNKYPKNSSTLRPLRQTPDNEKNDSVSFSEGKVSEKRRFSNKNTVKNLECRVQFLEKELMNLKKTIEEDKQSLEKKIQFLGSQQDGGGEAAAYDILKNEIIKIIHNDSEIKDEIIKIIQKNKRKKSIPVIPQLPIPEKTFKQWYSSFSMDILNSSSSYFFENTLVDAVKIIFAKNSELNEKNPSFYVIKKRIYIYDETGWKKMDVEDGKKFISKMISLFLTNFIKWRIDNQQKIEKDDFLAISETKYMKSISLEFKNVEKIFNSIKKWIICKHEKK